MKEENKVVGTKGETQALEYLKKNKYKILTTNYRNMIGEIDIIAQQKDYIVFVEVKTRETFVFGRPSEAVDRRKQHKIRLTAQCYLKGKRLYDQPCRFDCIEIVGNYLNHIENAF